MPLIETERYEIDPQPLGRGGFGEAYAARDLLFERDVVIKTIVASRLYGINEPRIRHQFFREALVAARLGRQTDRIVKVLDFGYDKHTDLPFFVMERIKGGDLHAEVGKCTWKRAALLLRDLFEALSVAHRNGVIHSDVSPDNILYDSEHQIYKLNDFGLAKLLNSILMSRGASLSITGGKPGYLPVEQVDTGDRDQYTDVYASAITIVNLVSGKVPRWRFDFTKKEMVGPDLSTILTTEEPDETLLEGDSPNMFSVACPLDGGQWQFPGRFSSSRQWTDLTVSDFIDLLSKILAREIVTIDEAAHVVRTSAVNRLLPREEQYRKERAVRQLVEQRKDAEQKDKQKMIALDEMTRQKAEREKQLAAEKQRELELRKKLEEELRQEIRAQVVAEMTAASPATEDA